MAGGFEGLEWVQNTEHMQRNGDWILDQRNALMQTEKKGLFGGTKANSADFQAVIHALDNINDVLDTSISENNEVWQTSLRLVFKGYETLKQACANYLTNDKGEMRSARSGVGQKRLAMVAEISRLADLDMECLMVQRFENPANIEERTVRGMLQKARTRVVEMRGTDKNHKHVGGSASNLTVLSGEETGGKAGFFGISKGLSRNWEDNIGSVFKETTERTGLSGEKLARTVEAIKGVGMRTSGESKNLKFKFEKSGLYSDNDPEIQEYLNLFAEIANGTAVAHENIFTSTLAASKSDSVNLANHNVASSRVAELLGRGGLIAKSERVELREEGKDSGRVGNLMEKAEGREAKELLVEVIAGTLGDDALNPANYSKAVKPMVTGGFQKDMADLQVLDYLCGQIDRHDRNYFIKTNEQGQYVGVQGIDNDLSFGDFREKDNMNIFASHGKRVVSNDGELFIPHMSRDLAIGIASLDESVARYALADLIPDANLEAFCKRLRLLKTAVKKELSKKPEESKLLTAGQWGDSTLEDFLSAEAFMNNGNKGSSNYIGTMINREYNDGEGLRVAVADKLKEMKAQK